MQKKANIIILTGAGISAESGLETFRDSNGTWNKYKIEDVATPKAFIKNPKLVHEFYNNRRKEANEAKPNMAHYALAQLEKNWQGDFLLVTQNVDDLHERAGSQHLIHMHGKLNSVICLECGQTTPWFDDVKEDSLCPHCAYKKSLRPDIVWFGEFPYDMAKIEEALYLADIFVTIGTSGQVYPAAGFINLAKTAKAECIEINLSPSHHRYSDFDEIIEGKASEKVPEFVQKILEI